MDTHFKKKADTQYNEKDEIALVTQEIHRFVSSIVYESLKIVIHGRNVVQIESREKIRFNENSVMSQKLSDCC